MFIKALNSYRKLKLKLDLHYRKIIKSRKSKSIAETWSCAIGMLFMFVFVMSLMIVKVSSTANLQNQTHAALRTRSIRNFVTPIITTDSASTTTTTATIIETTKKLRKRKVTKLSISNRTSTALAQKSPQSRRLNWKPSPKLSERKKMRADAVQQARERLQMQQQQQQKINHRQVQQQQQLQQQLNHHHQQQHQQQQRDEEYEARKSHRVTGEKAYLVEHGDGDDSAHEQPIYETWRAKARRSQAPLAQSQRNSAAATTAATPSQPTTTIATAINAVTTTAMASTTTAEFPPAPTPTTLANVSAAAAVITGDDDQRHNEYQNYHVYERLPRRSSTMTPVRNDLHDQIPRPPRLTTSRRPSSLLLRRQYLDTPLNTTASIREDYEQRPKPFHFPYEGPLPEEFKKLEPERSAVNNIQDILQQLHLSATTAPTRSTQLVMMPTGLHIAGSYKNLKASGIANFFRSKRNKKPVQFTIPIPVPMPMTMPMQFYGAFQPHLYPYPFHHNPQQQYHYSQLHSQHQPHQRIALDQIYPFKPRSPSEVNLLAMQQHQQQQQHHQQFNSNRFANKNKNKKNKHANLYDYSNNHNNNGLFIQQTMTNQRPEHLMPHYPLPQQPNVTQKQSKLRRVPFKLNLDIYPVLPAVKEPIPLPMRTPLALASPYAEYTGIRYPIAYSPSIYSPYVHPQYSDQSSIYNALRYRSPTSSPPASTPAPAHAQSAQMQQSSNNNNGNNNNMQFSFPDQLPKYSQQLQHHQLQQQQYQRPPLDPEQNSFQPMDCIDSSETEPLDHASYKSNSNANPNEIMVHLNVFPKQPKQSGMNLPSTNPFHNMQHRHAIAETPIQPRDFPRPIPISSANSTQQQAQQRIARSDAIFPFLADFEQPIVAANTFGITPAMSKVSSKLDISDMAAHYNHTAMRNNSGRMRSNVDPHLEQMAKEAKAASLFRFPVEDLIQFQIDDAL